jgi:hypothetical protein
LGKRRGIAEKQIEEKADWHQDGDRTPKGRRGNFRSGREANHHPRAAIGMIKRSRLQV